MISFVVKNQIKHICPECGCQRMKTTRLGRKWLCHDCYSTYEDNECSFKVVRCILHGKTYDMQRIDKCNLCAKVEERVIMV